MSEDVLTLRELFAVNPQDLSARVESGLDAYQAAQNARQEIAKASRTVRWPWVRKAVAEKSQDILDLNVVEVLLDGWKKYMEIQQYADPQKYARGETILAPLATRTIESHHQPCVQILVKEREVARIPFDLDLAMRLEGFVLKIQDGRVWEIQTGSGTGEASLSLAEVTLWKLESKALRFPGHISLGNGVPLRSELASAG